MYTQLKARITLQIDEGPIESQTHHAVEVTIVSFSAMWKVWVVSHHLSTNVCTSMPLAKPLGIKWMIGSKLVTRTKAFVSFVKALYQEEMQLVLPLLVKVGNTCKKEMKRSMRVMIGQEKWENE